MIRKGGFCRSALLCAARIFCLTAAVPPVKVENTELIVLQQRLLSLGYEIGSADGILGTKTTSAIRLAQTLLADA